MDRTKPTLPADQAVVVLRPDRRKTLGYLACSIVFVAAGLALAPANVARLIGVLFFALCAAIFVIQLMPGASYLRIAPEGFVFCSLFRRSPVIPWHEVGEFRVASIPPSVKKMVVYDWRSSSLHSLGRINQAIVGANAGLPDNYGMKPQDLADFLNARRSNAIQTSGNQRD